MQWLNRGGAKCAADFANSDVLCNLEDMCDGLQGMVGPHGEAIKEDGEDYSVKDKTPVVEVNSTD